MHTRHQTKPATNTKIVPYRPEAHNLENPDILPARRGDETICVMADKHNWELVNEDPFYKGHKSADGLHMIAKSSTWQCDICKKAENRLTSFR